MLLATLLLFGPPALGASQRLVPTPWIKKVAYTVDGRVRQYGPRARRRLRPYFREAGLAYPPERVVLVAIKRTKRLELYAAGPDHRLSFIRAWPILAASGRLGPKLRRGDYQVPEGVYTIPLLNPNSDYHLSLRVGYPNWFDRKMARRDGRRDLGGDIMIHGDRRSAGCLAVGDPVSEELFTLAADSGISSIELVISPIDFRRPNAPRWQLPRRPSWTRRLYDTLELRMNALPPAR
jgi:hypothetical protein